MRPERELVLCAARAKTPENDDRIRKLLHEEVDWSQVLVLAREHKLASRLEERLRNLDAPLVPQDQKERLILLARGLAKDNLAYLREMLWLCRTFEAAGIPAIPFKGPALGYLAYPNVAQRACVDLDFVLPQRYIPMALPLLEQQGYTAQFDRSEAEASERGPAPGQYAFRSSGKRMFVELHTERTLRYFSRSLPLDEMHARLFRFEIGRQRLCTFSVEDQLVMLSVHGAKHFWERLAWIVDIAQLIATREVDWSSLLAIAEQVQAMRLTLLGVFLAQEMIGAPLPAEVRERARGDAHVQWLAARVIQQFADSVHAGPGVWSRALFRFRSSDRFWPGLRQLIRLIMSPTETDREMIRLPGVLSPFYFVVRPFRLLREYGVSAKKNPAREASQTTSSAPDTQPSSRAESPGQGASERPPVGQRKI